MTTDRNGAPTSPGPVQLTGQTFVQWLIAGDVACIPDLAGQPGGWVEVARTNVRPRQRHRNTPEVVILDVDRLYATPAPDGRIELIVPPGADMADTLLIPAGTIVVRSRYTDPSEADR